MMRYSAGQVVNLLRARFPTATGEYAFFEELRNAAGYRATRSADVVVMGLWPSRGLHLSAFEVKVDRRDWLREKADPQKAEEVAKLVDFFWLVAPEGVALPEEVPPTWGIMTVKTTAKGKLVLAVDRQPQHLHPQLGDLSRGLVATMLKQAFRGITQVETAAVEQRSEERLEKMRVAHREELERVKAAHRVELEKVRAQENHVLTFLRENVPGVLLSEHSLRRAAEAFRAIYEGHLGSYLTRLEMHASEVAAEGKRLLGATRAVQQKTACPDCGHLAHLEKCRLCPCGAED